MESGCWQVAESIGRETGESEGSCVAQEKPFEPGVESKEEGQEALQVLASDVQGGLETEEVTFGDAVPVELR